MGSNYVDWNNIPQTNPKLLICFVFAILTWIFFGCGILSLYCPYKKCIDNKDHDNKSFAFDILAIGCCISAAAFGIAFLCCLHKVVKDILY